MKVVITDANIFMHLMDADLLESFFQLDFEISTTLEVFGEMGDENEKLGRYVDHQLELIISDEGQLENIKSMELPPGLSFPDRTVIFHALHQQCTVLTGEKLMTRECRSQGLTVHGLLWVLDQLQAANICSPAILHEKLSFLMTLGDFRVPKDECRARLNRWTADRES